MKSKDAERDSDTGGKQRIGELLPWTHAQTGFGRIIRELDAGDDVTITRHGKPWAKLVPVQTPAAAKPSLSTLRGALDELPGATYADFLDVKTIWIPKEPRSRGQI